MVTCHNRGICTAHPLSLVKMWHNIPKAWCLYNVQYDLFKVIYWCISIAGSPCILMEDTFHFLLQRRCVRANSKAMEKLCLFFRSGTKECVQGGIFIVYWDGLHQCNAVEIYICSLFPCEKGWKGDIQSSRLWREREKPHGQPQLFKLPGKRGTTLGHSYSSPAKPTEIHRVLLPIKSVGSW